MASARDVVDEIDAAGGPPPHLQSYYFRHRATVLEALDELERSDLGLVWFIALPLWVAGAAGVYVVGKQVLGASKQLIATTANVGSLAIWIGGAVGVALLLRKLRRRS